MHTWARRCTHHRVIWPGIIPARLLLAVSEAAIFAALVVARGFVAAPCPAPKIQPSVSQILDVNQTSPKFLLFCSLTRGPSVSNQASRSKGKIERDPPRWKHTADRSAWTGPLSAMPCLCVASSPQSWEPPSRLLAVRCESVSRAPCSWEINLRVPSRTSCSARCMISFCRVRGETRLDESHFPREHAPAST